MKRHIALQPLSREHHNGLLLAQLLRNDIPDYAGMPFDDIGKAIYAKEQFSSILEPHFQKEEIIFQLSKELSADVDLLINEVIAEHEVLKRLFNELNPSNTGSNQLHTIGWLLNDHIRKEERILFPLLEQYCPAALMNQFRLLL